ncbi:MAG: hypothetical protein QM811_14975 [Pirellulales bacterium]
MNEAGSGNSNLREYSTQLKQEIRSSRAKRDEATQLIQILSLALEDPTKLKEAPTRVFEAQPALKRMQEALVDAQIRAANLAGRMTPQHPEVLAARNAETEVRKELSVALEKFIQGLDSDRQVTQNQLESLESQLKDVEIRMESLATLRAPYNNLSNEVKRYADKLADEQKKLATARGIEAGAYAGSVLIRRDQPDAGTGPVGPGKLTLLVGGVFGGLMLGLGLVFVTVPLGKTWGRRFSDYMNVGRRASDRTATANGATAGTARRAGDPPPASPSPSTSRRAGDPQPTRGQRADDQPRGRRENDRAEQSKPAASEPTASLPVEQTV